MSPDVGSNPESIDLLIDARWVIPVNPAKCVLEDHSVAVRDGRIVAVLPRTRAHAAYLAANKNVKVVLEGHADERGTREYNLALAARRAQAVRDYLVSLGVSGARIETISYGKERPICAQSNDGCWAQNRRGLSTIKSGAVS